MDGWNNQETDWERLQARSVCNGGKCAVCMSPCDYNFVESGMQEDLKLRCNDSAT
jgi:hypothetical protein